MFHQDKLGNDRMGWDVSFYLKVDDEQGKKGGGNRGDGKWWITKRGWEALVK